MTIEDLLSGNEQFRTVQFEKYIDVYHELAKGQKPQVLWIGCSDSRLQTGHITDSMPGTLFIHRNIGNIAAFNDWNLSTVLEYGIKHLKVKHIVICGHSDCGAIKALDKDLDDAYIPNWLNNAMDAKKRVDAKIPKPVTPAEFTERSRMIEKENVRLQIEHLKSYPLVINAIEKEGVLVHGLFYDLETGLLTKIV
jgi:carbonic anhydrase